MSTLRGDMRAPEDRKLIRCSFVVHAHNLKALSSAFVN